MRTCNTRCRSSFPDGVTGNTRVSETRISGSKPDWGANDENRTQRSERRLAGSSTSCRDRWSMDRSGPLIQFHCEVAQLAELTPVKRTVVGSKPTLAANSSGCSSAW